MAKPVKRQTVMLLKMKSKIFILLAVGIFYFSINVYAQKTYTYTVQGTVFNSHSNQPVNNAQVWLYGKQIGDTTDNLGQFEFKVSKEYSETRMYVRICGKDIATSELVSFGADTLIEAEFYVSGIPPDCPSLPNFPWEFNPSEFEDYKGHLILDLHGVFSERVMGNHMALYGQQILERKKFGLITHNLEIVYLFNLKVG